MRIQRHIRQEYFKSPSLRFLRQSRKTSREWQQINRMCLLDCCQDDEWASNRNRMCPLECCHGDRWAVHWSPEVVQCFFFDLRVKKKKKKKKNIVFRDLIQDLQTSKYRRTFLASCSGLHHMKTKHKRRGIKFRGRTEKNRDRFVCCNGFARRKKKVRVPRCFFLSFLFFFF